MSFANKNMSVIAYANGFTLWHYASETALNEICQDGYFNAVRTLINVGDIVIINAAGGDTTMRVITNAGDCVKVGSLQ